MDALEFLKERKRMCNSYKGCNGCPLKIGTCGLGTSTSDEDCKRVIATVEQWSKKHPRKTRQSEFLKLFPDASLLTGNVNVCPNSLYEGKCDCAQYPNCFSCKREFWMQEVE